MGRPPDPLHTRCPGPEAGGRARGHARGVAAALLLLGASWPLAAQEVPSPVAPGATQTRRAPVPQTATRPSPQTQTATATQSRPVHQEGPATAPRVELSQDEGKIVREILVRGASHESVTRNLKTQIQRPLRAADVQDDLRALWAYQKIQVQRVWVEDVEGGVRLILEVREHRDFDRVVFKGLDHLTEQQVKTLLGIVGTSGVTEFTAQTYQRVLEERYRRDGFYHVRVQLVPDEAKSTLTFRVDEGPRVRVRDMYFRGNTSFPASVPLDLGRSLINGAKLETTPEGWLLAGSPYSEKAVEDDLDRLRLYYRRQGYRDAVVELVGRQPNEDWTKVDLYFRVVEGPRYRIASVDVEQVPMAGQAPRYPREALLSVVRTRPGDFYDRDAIQRDLRAIEEFYGSRGHPEERRYGRRIPNAFRSDEPVEVFDVDKAEVRLVFRVHEGTPKTLRDIVIRGNTRTKDRVIRRRVAQRPGEVVDITRIDRTIQQIEALRYFQDEQALTGVRFELEPVLDDPDRVDLAIDVTEGSTGQFLWGAGISSGGGVQARLQFTKRNFDIGNTPSSWDPFTAIGEILDNKAFHGGGQELDLLLSPGTEFSFFRLSFYEPDIFLRHEDTIGLRTTGFRSISFLDSYNQDSLGATVGLDRRFTDQLSAAITLRQESVTVEDVDPNAPGIVWDAKGQTELRTIRLSTKFTDLDQFLRPTKGFQAELYGEVAGGFLGAEEDFWKAGVSGDLYIPLYRDSRERAHVLHILQSFDYGHAYGDSNDLFLTDRFYMGGSNLRGFAQRRAGPSQFGRPVPGEVRYLGSLEYFYPLWSVAQEGRTRELELLRGVVFTDWGLLGLQIDDPTFREPRVSVGFGLRIFVPGFNVPIALDLGWPLVYEETDDRRQFYFSVFR